jgi:5-formyltetrahydrofolate cyclo-ligase
LTALKQIHVDLVIVASVVVNPITGARIGKGKGYGDLESTIMS